MNRSDILDLILIFCYIGVSYFLYQAIKSKNSIIGDLKVLLEGTDIKRLTEYYKATDALREKAITAQVQLILDEQFREHYASIGNQYDEMATFLSEFISILPAEERVGFVRRHLKHCEDMFQEALNAPEHPDYENDENEPLQ